MARADAHRNRERLIAAAHAAMTTEGPDASLEAIARAAGVGIATLYRNWPTRAHLIREVYADAVSALVDDPHARLAADPPVAALRGWISDLFDLAPSLRAVIESDPHRGLVDGFEAALAVLLDAARGELAGVPPRDLIMALAGIIGILDKPHDRARADALAELLLDGLRYRASSAELVKAPSTGSGDAG